MQTVYSITEARRQLEALAQQVSQGETFTITRYGKPVARFEPVSTSDGEHRATTEDDVTLR